MERAENATSGMATLAKSANSGIAKPERAENAASGNLPREAAAVRIARIEKQIAVLKAERRDAMIARIEKELTELKGHRGKIAPGTDEGGADRGPHWRQQGGSASGQGGQGGAHDAQGARP